MGCLKCSANTWSSPENHITCQPCDKSSINGFNVTAYKSNQCKNNCGDGLVLRNITKGKPEKQCTVCEDGSFYPGNDNSECKKDLNDMSPEWHSGCIGYERKNECKGCACCGNLLIEKAGKCELCATENAIIIFYLLLFSAFMVLVGVGLAFISKLGMERINKFTTPFKVFYTYLTSVFAVVSFEGQNIWPNSAENVSHFSLKLIRLDIFSFSFIDPQCLIKNKDGFFTKMKLYSVFIIPLILAVIVYAVLYLKTWWKRRKEKKKLKKPNDLKSNDLIQCSISFCSRICGKVSRNNNNKDRNSKESGDTSSSKSSSKNAKMIFLNHKLPMNAKEIKSESESVVVEMTSKPVNTLTSVVEEEKVTVKYEVKVFDEVNKKELKKSNPDSITNGYRLSKYFSPEHVNLYLFSLIIAYPLIITTSTAAFDCYEGKMRSDASVYCPTSNITLNGITSKLTPIETYSSFRIISVIEILLLGVGIPFFFFMIAQKIRSKIFVTIPSSDPIVLFSSGKVPTTITCTKCNIGYICIYIFIYLFICVYRYIYIYMCVCV